MVGSLTLRSWRAPPTARRRGDGRFQHRAMGGTRRGPSPAWRARAPSRACSISRVGPPRRGNGRRYRPLSFVVRLLSFDRLALPSARHRSIGTDLARHSRCRLRDRRQPAYDGARSFRRPSAPSTRRWSSSAASSDPGFSSTRICRPDRGVSGGGTVAWALGGGIALIARWRTANSANGCPRRAASTPISARRGIRSSAFCTDGPFF